VEARLFLFVSTTAYNNNGVYMVAAHMKTLKNLHHSDGDADRMGRQLHSRNPAPATSGTNFNYMVEFIEFTQGGICDSEWAEFPYVPGNQIKIVPDPPFDAQNLPRFTFALKSSAANVIGGSFCEKATVEEVPISKWIAEAWMRPEPGAVRESPWHATTAERGDLTNDLRYAIERNEFELHYQPQVSNGGNLVGFEALLRWRHPTRGNVPPAQFIPTAEEGGLILSIGRWVIVEACAQCKAWQSIGDKPVRIAVNVSAVQFSQPDFFDLVIGTIRQFDIDPHCLELEITESLLLNNTRRVIEKLTALRAEGVRIAIDDFGTGYSSLAYLQRLPIDSLKIDQSFVSNIVAGANNDGRRTAIVRAVTSLARDLGLNVIAEGVETTAQMQFLLHIGCHELQGYLFGEPQPAFMVQTMLERLKDSCQGIPPTVTCCARREALYVC
jgi:EAL domain-containing protein (putative c-di-GMP-specific phosphodiesterase class I)